jgi:NADPH:quinone reductase-like Zn-dependent oxidoreductase
MKAACFMKHGGPEVMELRELPDPAPAAGEVLVEVHAASVNGADWKVRAGSAAPVARFPYVPGRDFSGTVAALGAGVTDLAVGDAVFGVCDVGQEGAYAEKLAIKASIIAQKPASLSHVEAAALALAGLTALVSIEDTLEVKAGETVLVQGGAGGVASLAIQIAKRLGATVISTARGANLPYVKSLGADRVIDYEKEDFTTLGPVCDAVFETVGGEVATRSFAVVKPGGRAAFIASGASAPPSPRVDVRALRPNVRRDRPHLERLLALVAAGALRVPEIRRYRLDEAAAAHAVSEGRHLRGKLVFVLR